MADSLALEHLTGAAQMRVRLDPIVPFDGWKKVYAETIRIMFETISPDPVSPLNPRKIIMVAAALAAGILFLCTPLTSTCYAADKNTPRLYLGYVFTTHHTPLMVAVDRGDAFKNQGAFLKPIVPRQKYELMDGAGKSLAVINFIVSKSGSETVTLFAQGRMDIGLASGTAFIK